MKSTFILTTWFLLLASSSVSAQAIHCSRSINSILVKPYRYEITGEIFISEKTTLKPEATIFIDSVVSFLIDSSSYVIEVIASPDQSDPHKHTRLGQAREQAICDYIIKHGIESGRVLPHGYPETIPQIPVSNNSNNDQTQDKVEFRIIGMRPK